jgi:Ca2+-binding EF-hand superfamily protein
VNLKRLFRNFDNNGNGALDAAEFEAALQNFGLFLKKVEL